MTSVVTGDLPATGSYFDWAQLPGFERVYAVYELGENSVVVETTEGREVRITAWRDRSTGQYVADFERRGTLNQGDQQLRVWAHTNAYHRCSGDDVAGCLEAAIREVDRIHVNWPTAAAGSPGRAPA